jgi:hypothetical protein
MRLKEHQVAAMRRVARVKKMMKTRLEQVGSAGVTRNVPAKLTIGLVSAHHHGQGVPAHQRSQALFYREVTRERGLVLHGNGVHIRRVHVGLPGDTLAAGKAHELVEDVANARRILAGRQGKQCVAPLLRLTRVYIGSGRVDRMQVLRNIVHGGLRK